MRRLPLATLLVLGLLMAAGLLAAQDTCRAAGEEMCGSPHCCGCCGRGGACKVGCRLICTVKEEKKTVWDVQCESMCLVLPGCGPAHKVCPSDDCGECTGKDHDDCMPSLCKWLVPPKCGRERCVKKLVKREVTVKVPTYKCVPCYVCDECQQACSQEIEAAKAKIESAPTPQQPLPAPKAPAPQPLPKQAQNLAPLPGDIR